MQANQAAVEEYKKIIQTEGIDCDLRICNAYVYSTDSELLRQEAEAARRLGIHASFENHVEIPVCCSGAVCFPKQDESHPLKFITRLAEQLTVFPLSDNMHQSVRTGLWQQDFRSGE